MKKVMKSISFFLVLLLTFLFLIFFKGIFDRTVVKKDFPKTFGYSVAKVVSGSMVPTIDINDVIIIKDCEEYTVDDIITYYDNISGYVTHRIVDIKGGKYVTKGDGNDAIDEKAVSIEQVQGKVVYVCKGLWNIIEFMWSKDGIWVIMILLFIVFFAPHVISELTSKKKRGETKSNIVINLLAYLMFFVAIFAVIFFTFARATGVLESGDTATVARFTLGVDDEDIKILEIENIKPGYTKSVNIVVKNNTEDLMSDVAQGYQLFISMNKKENSTYFLPLTFNVKPLESPTEGMSIPDGDIEVEEGFGKTEFGKMPASTNSIEHKYVLTISWPLEMADYKYESQKNTLGVCIKTVQLDVY